MLQLKNLLCSRNDSILFNKVDCNLQAGQVLQVSGANGSGKSTLLRTIAGFLKPYSGLITHKDMELCYVGHRSGLHPDLSVLQNLLFLHAFVATNSAQRDQEVVHSLATFTLQSKKDFKLNALSAGQAQQVSLARLCMSKAQIWILDEPLVHLDQQASQTIYTICMQHLQRNGILILATHKLLDFAPFVTQNIILEKAA